MRNPGGIFLLQPALPASTGARRRIHSHYRTRRRDHWPGATDDQPGGVNLGFIRAVAPAWDLLHNADGALAGTSSIRDWNLADPKAAGTPELVSNVFAYAA
jgi:hypothetical protein